MGNQSKPIVVGSLWHGADYNPEQWPHAPEVWQEDLRLMKLAGINEVSVGIFSWASLEPSAGEFDFQWLDRVMDGMADYGIQVVLATPSGARPAWMAAQYPEVLRVDAERQRHLFGERHNHCYTSPVYRRLTGRINEALARRYGGHPALKLWHLSNEYGGECHCDLCQAAFRDWLRRRYQDLGTLNRAWWTSFWSHTYTAWEQIESPSGIGTSSLHGLNLDWKRFVSAQTLDFMLQEIAPLRQYAPTIGVSTNFMGTYPGINYWRLAPHLDIISWDSYPAWDATTSDIERASQVGFLHDINRSLGQGRPFLLMESTPSVTNWQTVSKLKRPGMHHLSSLQAVAHGSDSVQYFQWRKSRGSSEKFHGAVVDHVGHEDTRVFQEVARVGRSLAKLAPLVGSLAPAQVAVIYDWENRWAIDGAAGPRQHHRDYQPTCEAHYRSWWRMGTTVDVLDMEQDLAGYKIVIAPMLYMLRAGVEGRLRKFVEAGGTLVLTYWSGVVDETDLCYLGGVPGPLKALAGLWVEEIDALYDGESNTLRVDHDNPLQLSEEYRAHTLCERIRVESATVLARYGQDFYAGEPVLTMNRVGSGHVYYIAARTDQDFLDDFYRGLSRSAGVETILPTRAPDGVSVQMRQDAERQWIFLMNFSTDERTVEVGNGSFHEMLQETEVSRTITLDPYQVAVLERRGP